MKKYYVINRYSDNGRRYSWHKTIKAATKAARKHEGEGWGVVDEDGARWWWDEFQGDYSV